MSLALRRMAPPPKPATPHWYYDADPEDRREYDAFGPWIGEIAAERDMPRLFRPFWPRVRDARYLVKIPIEVERARARPGWDLYRAVLAVDDAGITYLAKAGDGVTVAERRWADIAAVRGDTNLLIGRWRLIDRAGGTLDVDYNTVSGRLMDAVTELVRARIAWDAPAPAPLPNAGLAGPEPLFRYLLFQLARTGPQPATPVHVEAAGRWCRDGGAWRRLSTARMAVVTPAELVLVDRGEPSRSFWAPCYASAVTAIPWTRLTGFAFHAAEPARPPRLHTLTLHLGDARVLFPCLDVPEAVFAALAARGVPRLAA